MARPKDHMSEFTKKILDTKNKLHYSITDIQQATEISRPYISNILNGTVPSDEIIAKLSSGLDLDFSEMLLLAKKAKVQHPEILEIFKTLTKGSPDAMLHAQILDEIIAAYNMLSHDKRALTMMVGKIAEKFGILEGVKIASGQRANQESEHTTVPLAQQKVSAGNGHLIIETEKICDLAFRRDWLAKRGGAHKKVVLPVSGDSMEPVISHGDVVLVDQSQNGKIVRNGQIYVVNDPDNGVFVKQVYQEKTGLQLVSYNKTYPPCFLPVPEGVVSPIVGRVIWWAHAVDPD